MKTQVFLGSAILLAGILVNAVNAANKCDSYIPRHYIARHISSPIKVDGSLDDEAWKKASWSVPFTNINDGANVSDAFKTRVKLLWDERFVYFGAEIFDPTSVPSNTSDPEKFSQSNFGILVDPGRTNHNYKEVRVNPFGRTRQFAWSKPPSNGGCATDDWSLGAASSYAISINAKKSMSRVNLGGGSWTLEWVLPLSSLQMSKKRGLFDFGYRSNWQFVRTGWGNSHYRKRSNIPLSNNSTNTHYQYSWTPQYSSDVQNPEWWGVIEFSNPSQNTTGYEDPTAVPRYVLGQLYRAERRYFEEYGKYTSDISELTVDGPELGQCGDKPQISLINTNQNYIAKLEVNDEIGHIRDDRLLWFTSK